MTRHSSTRRLHSSPRGALVAAGALAAFVVLAAACSSDLAAGELRRGTATSSANSPAGDSTAALQQAPAAEAPALPAGPLFIANTGGTGLALRPRCEDGARLAGTGVREGAEVAVVGIGGAECTGWTLVDAAGTQTWVRNDYLARERPAVVAAPRTAPVAPSGPPASGGGAPPASVPRFEKVLVYGAHLIPISQLTYRSADYGPILMTPTGPKAGAYICPVYNYSAPAVRTVLGVVLQNPDPEGCGFARADNAVIRDALVQ